VVNAQTELTSGEGVAFDLNHAGVGSRLVAASIDLALQVIASFILLAATGGLLQNADDAAVGALVIVELVLVVAGYPILMEWLAHGRTIGKMCLGLRVVRDDGGPIGFRQALVRGLAGLVLEKPGLLAPFTTAAGVLTMIFSQRTKRIGDMMAGTFVLNERAGPQRSLVARDFGVPYQLQPWAASLDLSRLDDQLALGVRQFVVRATDMTPAAQQSLGEDLRARVEAVTTPPPPPGTPTPWVLITVLAERRRRADLVAPQYQQLFRYAPPQYAPPGYTAPPQQAPRPDALPPSPFAPPS
jgi:uncharacterized RDD family membrane protein YckC